MYRFKRETLNELLQYRTITGIAKKLDMNPSYLARLFRGEVDTKFPLAFTLSTYIGNNNIEYYFDKIERDV